MFCLISSVYNDKRSYPCQDRQNGVRIGGPGLKEHVDNWKLHKSIQQAYNEAVPKRNRNLSLTNNSEIEDGEKSH